MPSIRLEGHALGLLVSCVGAVAFLLQGYDQAVVNGLLTLPTWEMRFPSINTSADKSQSRSVLQGTIVALYEVGCSVGALSCCFLGDFLGRRKTIFLAACIIIIGVIIQATPFSLGQLIPARIITGLGVGAFTATVPMWVTECSKAHNRGRLVMMEGCFAIGGVCFATWLDFGFYFVKNNSVNWRFPIAFQLVFALIVLSLIFYLPESPRWLIKQDDYEGAMDSLSRLEGLPRDSRLIAHEISTIKASIDAEHVGTSGNPFATTRNRHLHRTLLAMAVNMLAQMTGVNIVTFYSNTIFQNILGYSPVLSRVISGCLQIWQFLCATLAMFLVDRIGRRKLLLIGSFGMIISQSGLAALTKYAPGDKRVAGATLLFDFMSLFFFPIGLFLIPFMYAAEISPLRIRAKVTAMSASTNWIFNFLLAEVTPLGFDNLGWKYYLVYVCTSSLAFAVFFLFCPETKERPLEDIDEIFLRSSNIFEPVKIAKTLPVGAGAELDIENEKAEQEEVVVQVS
ncbi:hypothetical protein PV08_06574 [Exophiala spinifera]|uniref:Major facilitator superfamily (MFS) profile domain-containing protein n=1 Tax=Exophiala spinifera TaxID=91928 RepID=A0A0D2BZ09_9EURO|nr:uncharacterized protein PV08_06574 [Exophiala spinifera]KIW16519.1 hypothetical protein PV08_06574 [Exophiala spinifera]